MGRAGETVIEKCHAPCAAQSIAKELCTLHSRTDVLILGPEDVIVRPLKVCVLQPFRVTKLRTHNLTRLSTSWLGMCSSKWFSYVDFGVLVSAITATWTFVIVQNIER